MISINTQTGLLEKTSYLPSPHYNKRPENEEISLIVIHNISLPPGQFGGELVNQFLCGTVPWEQYPQLNHLRDLQVAPHLMVRRNGDIVQYVPLHLRAWHAGVSQFSGRQNCNDFSIGIEVEGTDDLPFEEIQYQQLARICRALLEVYPAIKHDNIVGHADIAPGRKTDPGPMFNWQKLKQMLKT